MSVSEPAASRQGLTPAETAAAAGVAGTAAVAAAPPVAAAGMATMAGIGATAIVASLLSFLTLLREANRRWLMVNLGRYSRVPGDIAQVIADEMRLEEAFAQASADRLAAGLPEALQITDPAQRAAAVKRLLDAEERYAQQRQEAMAARAIAAVTRAQLRRDSPLGAFWRLGRAKDHTPGCIVMAGGDHEGAGKFWPWAVLDRVHPPRHYGCLLGGTRVWGPRVRSAMRRDYEGEILRITFTGGHEIGITPNHPVLKRSGWIAADALRVGDQVVRCEVEELRLLVGDPHEVQMPTAIEEVAGALADAGDVEAVRVPVAAEDFHGDGREGYVDVVRATSLLRDESLAASFQPYGEFALGSRDGATALLTGDGSAGERVGGVGLAALGGMSGSRLGSALRGGESAHLKAFGFASRSHPDATVAQAAVNHGRGDADLLSDLLGRCASEIPTHEVVNVERYAYRGQVYNLETEGSWYSAEGIVVHNCTSTLHSFGEAIREGWMRPGDVPDTREAIRAAAGVLMEEREAEALERELELREALVEAGVVGWDELALRPWEGVAEAFSDAEHPRDWKGRFRSVGEVATRMAELSTAWRGRMGAPADPDAPSFEQQVKNWTGHLRGRLSKDRTALGVVAAANAENARLPLYQRIVAAHEPDHVVVITPSAGRKRMSLMDQAHDVPHRVAGTTAVPDETVKAIGLRGTGKAPADHPAASSGYGMAAVLRHEYGHSIDDTLPRDVRRRVLATIPDPAKDLTYYAGTGDQEVIPELLALITHPDYRRQDWPETVQNAERELLKALGVTPPSGGGGMAADALKRGEPVTIKPSDAPALIDALNDGSTSSLHKLQVEGHPNLFRAHARELSRAQMPQVRKAALPGFMDFLRQHRVSGVVEQRHPSELRATQNQINGGAVAALAKGWDPTKGNVIMVSQAGDVLDGHHRWAAAALDELSHPERTMGVLRFSAGTDRILALMRQYNELTGSQGRAFGESSQNIPKAGSG